MNFYVVKWINQKDNLLLIRYKEILIALDQGITICQANLDIIKKLIPKGYTLFND